MLLLIQDRLEEVGRQQLLHHLSLPQQKPFRGGGHLFFDPGQPRQLRNPRHDATTTQTRRSRVNSSHGRHEQKTHVVAVFLARNAGATEELALYGFQVHLWGADPGELILHLSVPSKPLLFSQHVLILLRPVLLNLTGEIQVQTKTVLVLWRRSLDCGCIHLSMLFPSTRYDQIWGSWKVAQLHGSRMFQP